MKFKHIVKATALALALTSLSGCSFVEQNVLHPFLREAGVPEEAIQEVSAAMDQAEEELQKQLEQVQADSQKLLSVLTDEVAELAADNDEAYALFLKAYQLTHTRTHYSLLEARATDGLTPYSAAFDADTARYPCAITDKENNSGSLNPPYVHGRVADGNNPYSVGQCTWYCYGRFLEDNGIALGQGMGNAVQWLDGARSWVKAQYKEKHPDADPSLYTDAAGYLDAGVFVTDGAEKIYPHSIAVCTSSQAAGHVVYIEDVEYRDGMPATVYFSEANWRGETGALDPWDGVLQSMSYEDFLSKRKVKGYIVPMNMFAP